MASNVLPELRNSGPGISTAPGAHPKPFSFSIIYRDEPSADSVSVLAIAHHKRKPGYWKNRI